MIETVILLLLFSGSFVAATPEYSLELVQVVHRHGSRSPIVSYNKTEICGLRYPCGILNEEGQTMLVNFGSFLHNRYTNETIISEPFFSNSYNLSISMSRSTDVLRTLQSADGFLRGLFPNMEAYYPAIHTVESASDMLLRSSTVPEVSARLNHGGEKESELCDPLVDALFPNIKTLQSVAAEVYSSSFCADPENRTKCAMQLCDIGRAYESLGTLQRFPKLNQHLQDVCTVLACSSSYLFGYDPSNSMDQQRGSFGQPLAQQLLTNIQNHIASPSFKLYEYSAHDTTISPLAVTFGDNSYAMMEPPFASAFIIELLMKDKKYFVRLLFGHAGTTPQTNFIFGLTDFSMKCMKDGQLYVAEDNICPLEDFTEFIDSTKGTEPNGFCLVDPQLLKKMECSATIPAKKLSSECATYRKQCPALACGSGRVATAENECIVIAGTSSKGISGWTIFFLMLLSFAAGVVALYFVPTILLWWNGRKNEATITPV